MQYIDLVNRAKIESGIAGAALTTLSNQSREITRLATWVKEAWIDLQREYPDWDFLRRSIRFNTVYGTTFTEGQALTLGCVYEIVTQATLDFDTVGELYTGTSNVPGATYLVDSAATLGVGDEVTLIAKQGYSIADLGLTDFGQWRNESFRSYLKSAGVGTEVYLTQYFQYTDFRDFYLLGTRKLVQGRPLYFTIAPDRSILLGFAPNDIYVVTGEYYRSPQELALDTDIPIMPERYHMAIVYKAVEKYGLFNVANEQITIGRDGYNKILNHMSMDQLPMIGQSGSMI